MGSNKTKSALSVTQGISQPSPVNRENIENLKKSRKPLPTAEELFEGIRSGNRTTLSQSITITESVLPAHHALSRELIRMCIPHSGNSIRIGITGVPGAGKSTFIETFGNNLINKGERIAVLAIDPSSMRSGGSILGDKTRMETLAGNEKAFIRPSPSGGSLGGVARNTRESIILCETAGFNTIIIETVGVGQSETTVHSMVDFFLLLMIPGAGDELQGMKRGIMEMADAIVINKADGDNLERANSAKAEYTNAIHLFPVPPSKWIPRVMQCSSIENRGIEEIWNMIYDYKEFVKNSGYFQRRRREQGTFLFNQSIQEELTARLFGNMEMNELREELLQRMKNTELSAFEAAEILLEKYFSESGK